MLIIQYKTRAIAEFDEKLIIPKGKHTVQIYSSQFKKTVNWN